MKGLDTFDFTDVTLPAGMTKEILTTCDFVKDKHNLILYGRPGTGKTHLATALGIQACQRDYQVMYYRGATSVSATKYFPD